MTRALEQHQAKKVKLIPILIKHCMWQNLALSKLQFIPRDDRPNSTWEDRDEAYLELVKEIIQVIEQKTK